MAGFPIVITDAGLAEIVNAENSGTAPVLITEIAFGTGQYEPSETQTALVNEFKRLSTISGDTVGPGIIQINVNDGSADAYEVYEFGLFTESGTLLGVYSQTGSAILNKTSASIALLSSDIKLTQINVESITFGDTNFLVASATEARQGIAEIATQQETDTGTDDQRMVTPKKLQGFTTQFYKYATQAEAEAGTSNGRVMSPLRSFQAIEKKTPEIARKDYRKAEVGAGITLVAHETYHIATNNVYTLPDVTNLAGGATIVLTKSIYNTPTIQVHGGNSENIRIGKADGSTEFDTSILFDINSEIILVWNGASWEV